MGMGEESAENSWKAVGRDDVAAPARQVAVEKSIS